MADSSAIKTMVLNAVGEAMSTVRQEVIEAVKEIAGGDLNTRIKRAIDETSLVAETSQHAVKKLRTELPPTFKGIGNKNQFTHNEKLRDIIQDSLHSIEINDVEKAKEKLEEGKRAIDRRIKLIKLADREEDGWEVVKHYEADDLAENSDDEKQIAKARKLAASAKKKRSTDRQNKKRREHTREVRSGTQQKFFSGSRPQFGKSVSSQYAKSFNSERRCYLCHQTGHLQSMCPLKYDTSRY